MLKKELDISREQIEKIRNLEVSHKKEMIQLKASMEVARIELSELLMKPETDEEKLENQLNKLSGLTAQIQKSRIQLILGIKKLLTKEQLEKFSSMGMPIGPMRMGERP